MSNCGTPTVKVSIFLDQHSQPTMRSGMSYVKDDDFLTKAKNLNKVPAIVIIVTPNTVGLITSISHNEGPKILKKQFDSFDEK